MKMINKKLSIDLKLKALFKRKERLLKHFYFYIFAVARLPYLFPVSLHFSFSLPHLHTTGW